MSSILFLANCWILDFYLFFCPYIILFNIVIKKFHTIRHWAVVCNSQINISKSILMIYIQFFNFKSIKDLQIRNYGNTLSVYACI